MWVVSNIFTGVAIGLIFSVFCAALAVIVNWLYKLMFG